MVYRILIDLTQKQDESLRLTPEQQHYLSRVLRLKAGDRFVAMDGKGHSWMAQLSGNTAQLLETLAESTELPVPVTLLVALPKGNGFEEIVRCCTELGVTAFIPAISDRTLLHPSPHKWERWRKIAQEAAEQSERQFVPEIAAPLDLQTALQAISNLETERYICVTRRETHHLLAQLPAQLTKPIAIATGPEGGWTAAEVESAIAAGFQPVSLGDRILRAVTAPIVAASLVAAVLEYSS